MHVGVGKAFLDKVYTVSCGRQGPPLRKKRFSAAKKMPTGKNTDKIKMTGTSKTPKNVP